MFFQLKKASLNNTIFTQLRDDEENEQGGKRMSGRERRNERRSSRG
jgi:hypothetical protein